MATVTTVQNKASSLAKAATTSSQSSLFLVGNLARSYPLLLNAKPPLPRIEPYAKIRNTDPNLLLYPQVYFAEVYNPDDETVIAATSFVVCTDGMPAGMVQMIPLSVQDIPIHVLPKSPVQAVNSLCPATTCTAINPLAIPPSKVDADIVRLFPTSVGYRSLVFGHIVILFRNEKDAPSLRNANNPVTIGGLPYSFDTLRISPTSSLKRIGKVCESLGQVMEDSADAIRIAHQLISDQGLEDSYQRYRTTRSERIGAAMSTGYCSLGIKLRLPDGTIAWTSPTHAWMATATSEERNGQVKQHQMSMVKDLALWRRRVWIHAKNWIHRRVSAKARKDNVKSPSSFTQVGSPSADTDSPVSPLNQHIYISQTDGRKQQLDGVVSRIFDQPRGEYPEGYDHDLALITAIDETLLPCTQHPDLPPLIHQFAKPAEALRATFIYCLQRARLGVDNVLPGTVIPTDRRDGLIAGVEVVWGKGNMREPQKSRVLRRSLLWRTYPLQRDVKSLSGTLLCTIEERGEEKVSVPLLFQNFQSGSETDPSYYKGGFFLPSEVMESTIIIDDVSDLAMMMDTSPSAPVHTSTDQVLAPAMTSSNTV